MEQSTGNAGGCGSGRKSGQSTPIRSAKSAGPGFPFQFSAGDGVALPTRGRESLRRLGIPHDLEYLTADGLFSIDLAIVDRRIAIEFDGPSHFSIDTLERLGHTCQCDGLLSDMGWHVVSIPFFDWDKLHRSERMDAYVKQRLSPYPPKPKSQKMWRDGNWQNSSFVLLFWACMGDLVTSGAAG